MLPFHDRSALEIPRYVPRSPGETGILRWRESDPGSVHRYCLADRDPFIDTGIRIGPGVPVDPYQVNPGIAMISAAHNRVRVIPACYLDYVPVIHVLIKQIHELLVDACDAFADIPVICLCHPQREFLCTGVHEPQITPCLFVSLSAVPSKPHNEKQVASYKL
ncbi:MAG: hypothetical protein C5S49_07260 [Candidatus Methanogaster sp.]|nr:MAG: hypothetical protein C5S49_07260 [ANME-2 cluster archaeon]